MTDREPQAKTKSNQSVPTSLRLTPHCLTLLDGLASKLGLKKTGVVELAVRRMAAQEGVEA